MLKLKLSRKVETHKKYALKFDPLIENERQILNKTYALMSQMRKKLITMERKYDKNHLSAKSHNQSVFGIKSLTIERVNSQDKDQSPRNLVKLKNGQMISPLKLTSNKSLVMQDD